MKILILTILFILLLASFGLAQQARWNDLYSKEGAFSILMPGIPVKRKESINMGAFSTDIYVHKFQKDSITEFFIGYIDFPKSVDRQILINNFLNNANAVAIRMNSKLVKEE